MLNGCLFSSRLRIRDCLTQLYAKDITPDDKQELDEALQREVLSWKLFLYLSLSILNFMSLKFPRGHEGHCEERTNVIEIY